MSTLESPRNYDLLGSVNIPISKYNGFDGLVTGYNECLQKSFIDILSGLHHIW